MQTDSEVFSQSPIGPNEIAGRWIGFASAAIFNTVLDFSITAKRITERNLRNASQFFHQAHRSFMHGGRHPGFDQILHLATRDLGHAFMHSVVNPSDTPLVTAELVGLAGWSVLASVLSRKLIPSQGQREFEHVSYHIPTNAGILGCLILSFPGLVLSPGSLFTFIGANLLVTASLASAGGSVGRTADNRRGFRFQAKPLDF